MINSYKLISIKEVKSKSILKDFDCNEKPLNDFLSQYAQKNDELGIGRTFVALDEKEQIVGYFTLATAQIAYNEISDVYKGKLPKYPIPALRIARLAVHKNLQGNGVGKWLLSQAFLKIVQVADITGLYFILVDPKESSKNFYYHYGFKEITDKEDTLFIMVETVRKAINA